MKKKILITMITLICMTCLTNKVKASTDFTPLYRPPGIYDCTASGCTSKTVSRSNFTYNGQTYNTYTTDDNLVIASNGVAINVQPNDILKAGYLYSLGIYYCNYESLSDLTTYRIYPGTPDNEKDTYYSSWINTRLTNMPTSGLGSYCYKATTILSPKENATTYNLRLKKSSGTGINFTPYVYGYEVNELGIYTTEIQNAINNAIQSNNLATTQSIEQLREELTQAQQEATEEQIESQKVCNIIDKNSIILDGKLNQDGTIGTSGAYGVTDYIKIGQEISYSSPFGSAYFCWYDSAKTLISCIQNSSQASGILTPPSNAYYFRASIEKANNKPQFKNCSNGNQGINDTLNQEHEYNNNPSQSTTQQENTMNNFEQQEDTLRNNLNLNIEDAEVTINPNASSFIWEVINRLRGISGKIVLLFTSILSLGLMKMILGR